MQQVYITLYNLRHTQHYFRMKCAITELHFAEFGAMFLFSVGSFIEIEYIERQH